MLTNVAGTLVTRISRDCLCFRVVFVALFFFNSAVFGPAIPPRGARSSQDARHGKKFSEIWVWQLFPATSRHIICKKKSRRSDFREHSGARSSAARETKEDYTNTFSWKKFLRLNNCWWRINFRVFGTTLSCNFSRNVRLFFAKKNEHTRHKLTPQANPIP